MAPEAIRALAGREARPLAVHVGGGIATRDAYHEQRAAHQPIHVTNTTRGGRRARHPKTTLPHRPPGPLAAVGLLGGRPQAPARFGGG